MLGAEEGIFTRRLPVLPEIRRDERGAWVEADGVRVRLSNLDKVLFPQNGITKGDLVAYYLAVAPVILPYLRGRPIAMRRLPDGIDGVSFFEDAAPEWTPEWVTRCAIESSDGDVDALTIVDGKATLAFCANSACIDLHPFHSRCETYDRPDYLVFDLDPFPPATFEDALAVARHVGVALQELGLRGYPKTSGGTGVHVYVPVDPRHSYEETRAVSGRIAELIMRVDPGRVTMAWSVAQRAGMVFIDHKMNRRAASLACAYAVRPRPGAPVSAPLTWQEVGDGEVVPEDLTMETIFDRMRTAGDPFAPVLTDSQDLDPVLDALGLSPSREDISGGRLRHLLVPARQP